MIEYRSKQRFYFGPEAGRSSLRSGYSREVETALEETDDVLDTLQWWFSDGDCWRIQTYVVDHQNLNNERGEDLTKSCQSGQSCGRFNSNFATHVQSPRGVDTLVPVELNLLQF